MRKKMVVYFILTLFVISAAGCASRQVPEFHARYYPQCYDPIDKLCKDQSHAEEAKGALTGGLIGALGGAIVGGLTSGKVEGALIGAAAGAATGALTGFFSARLSKINDQNKRLEEYQNVLGEQSRGWDLERASVERAYACYGEQIDLLKTAMASKRITREEFLARMAEIKSGINNINTYWANAQTRMDEALADGDDWLAKEDAAAARAKKQQQMSSRINKQRQNTKKARQNNTVANNRVNKQKEATMVALNSLEKYMETDSQYTSLEQLFASL